MFDPAEIERIDNTSGAGGEAPPAFWAFSLDLGDDPPGALARIREVARKVAIQSDVTWPNDDYWRTSLPPWLVGHMPELCQEEADRLIASTPRDRWNALPWTLGSWLDAMRERGWKWWSCDVSGKNAKVVLQITEIPPRIEAFKQILLAAGATIVTEHRNDAANSG